MQKFEDFSDVQFLPEITFSQFSCLKIAYQKSNSRKILVVGKFLNFHTVLAPLKIETISFLASLSKKCSLTKIRGAYFFLEQAATLYVFCKIVIKRALIWCTKSFVCVHPHFALFILIYFAW